MKILVTGANGKLGFDVLERLRKLGIECLGVDAANFSITKAEKTIECIKEYAPTVIIHCAAYTAVDSAEEERDICERVNVTGTQNVLEGAKAVGAKFVYISTDYVFAGEGQQPYTTQDETQPLNFYGKSKLKGEELALSYDKSFVVRISWVFGKNGNNFISTILRLAQRKSEIDVVDDQIGSPTYTYDLAKLLCEMIQTEKYGIYHATNEGYCSWAEFARHVFECAGLPVVVKGIPGDQYQTAAVRPKNSRMDKSSLDEAGFARLPDWKDAVARYVGEVK